MKKDLHTLMTVALCLVATGGVLAFIHPTFIVIYVAGFILGVYVLFSFASLKSSAPTAKRDK